MWLLEIENRTQAPGESVDDYASSIQQLYHRVAINPGDYPDAVRARKFVSGLLPELYMAVTPFQENTLQGAITRAKTCEPTMNAGKAKLLNYANRVAAPTPSTEVMELTKLVAALTQQVAELSKPSYQKGPRNNNAATGGTTSRAAAAINVDRKPIVCYACGEPGHISRHCPKITAASTTTAAPATVSINLAELVKQLINQSLN